ncbi:TPA: protein tyrosine phosphatase [Klebsiella quasipneumoniae]|nr:protein tyrosine phosphatase [Klebsiella quasipneumoniae]
MFESILVICTGNICRSPIAERILKSLLPSKHIESAGVVALINHPADGSAIRVAEKHNLHLDGHVSRQLTSKIASQYDVILVMEQRQIEHVCRIAPEARGKTLLLGHWLGAKEIPDPYRKSDEAFESVYQLIDQCCQNWAEKLV